MEDGNIDLHASGIAAISGMRATMPNRERAAETPQSPEFGSEDVPDPEAERNARGKYSASAKRFRRPG